jgi:hypothetical protein
VLGIPEDDLLVMTDRGDDLHLGVMGYQDLISNSLHILRGIEPQEKDSFEVH